MLKTYRLLLSRILTFLVSGLLLLLPVVSRPQETAGAQQLPTAFVPAAPQGFGDRQNGWAWAMEWWRGYLYVGTNRAFHCAEMASLNRYLPTLFPYPPTDPDVECTPDPLDLPLQAEIWRWSAQSGEWERVYQSPAEIPVPGQPGKFLPYEIGYRGMLVFREPDGSEALYVGGVSPQFLGYEVPPPRILRSTDGVNFAPVPQNPGTLLGGYTGNNFRNPISHNGKFYIMGGTIQGSGILLEATNPALGDDNFRVVSPPGTIVSAVSSFNGYLYLGVRSVAEGYGVIKTTAAGEPPYEYTTVIEHGAFINTRPNVEVLSMKEFQGKLYVGCNGIQLGSFGLSGPAELVRIHPDDSWEVVVGAPRLTPGGLKVPLSGYNAGFGSEFNAHMWRMETFNDRLYVGTFDSSTTVRTNPDYTPYISSTMGFDLYETTDGVRFTPITRTGFDDKFNFGVRTMEATPYGLFLGTANYYYGLQIWRATPPGFQGFQLQLPMLIVDPVQEPVGVGAMKARRGFIGVSNAKGYIHGVV